MLRDSCLEELLIRDENETMICETFLGQVNASGDKSEDEDVITGKNALNQSFYAKIYNK